MKILHNLVTKRFLQRKFTNVKLKYEIDQKLLSSCYILVQIDGLNFKTFTKINNFIKPNDQSNINLMNSCSMKIFETLRDHLIYSYGFSDEFSFVFEPKTKLYDRRYNLYASLISSKFTSYYCLDWPEFFNEKMVLYPNFRSKIFLLPTKDDLISFFEARQLECHQNYLYNKSFWSLILNKNISKNEARKELIGKSISDLNELLFKQFGINYNNEPEVYRKGTFQYKDKKTKEICEVYISLKKNSLIWQVAL